MTEAGPNRSIERQKELKILVTSLFLAIQFALCIYLQWIPYPIRSKRALVAIVFLIGLFTICTNFILSRWILIRFQRTTKTVFCFTVLASLIFGGLLLAVQTVPVPDRYFFLPDGSVKITAIAEKNPLSSGKKVEILFFDTGTTDNINALEQAGNWSVQNKTVVTEEEGSLYWNGKVFHRIQLLFASGPDCGIVRIDWAGKSQRIDLYAEQAGEILFTQDFPFSWINRAIIILAYWIGISFLFLLFMTLTVPVKLQKKFAKAERIPAWWVFALPMIFVWTICLLTFWPGILTPDSIVQWGQAVAKVPLDNRNPAIYTLLIRLLTTAFNTPAIVAFAQILALSLVTAGGIRFLLNQHISIKTAWILSFIMAFSPVNLFFPITIWKDVPYGISMLAVFLILLQIVISDGVWLKKRSNRIWLILSGICLSLFRHNGFPVLVATLVIFLLLYRQIRGLLFQALVVIIAAYGLVLGPVYSIFHVTKGNDNGINPILVHYISAHIEAETPLTESERTWLNQVYPLDQWKYDPCVINNLWFLPGFNEKILQENPKEVMNIFLSLSKKAPSVSLRHAFQSSNMIWKIQHGGCYLYRIGLMGQSDGTLKWVEANQFGVVQESKLPKLTNLLFNFFLKTAGPTFPDAIFWRPAIYTYWTLLVSTILALRFLKPRYLLIGLLTLIQSGMMLFITIAQDMRYQYGVMLIGIFCIGLLFLPKTIMPETKNQSDYSPEEINR